MCHVVKDTDISDTESILRDYMNALLGGARQATGAVRVSDAKGRHTTTRRELLEVPGGGCLIDTPGMRELGLWEAGDGVDKTFAELTELAAACRFRDCQHQGEPGCAVAAALESGTLDADCTPTSDHHLPAGSPCINAGTTVGAPSVDFDDQPRDSEPDIGPDEYVP